MQKFWNVFQDVLLIGGVAFVPVVALEVVVDGIETEGIGWIGGEDLDGRVGSGC